MHCPFCMASDTKVVDSRLVTQGRQIRRRRACSECGERFTTFEAAELLLPRVVKSNGDREPFNEEKLMSGVMKALEKRPVSSEAIDNMLNQVKDTIRASGEREVPAKWIGELMMEALKNLDEIAFVRFASVYRHFKDLDELRHEIDKLATADAKPNP